MRIKVHYLLLCCFIFVLSIIFILVPVGVVRSIGFLFPHYYKEGKQYFDRGWGHVWVALITVIVNLVFGNTLLGTIYYKFIIKERNWKIIIVSVLVVLLTSAIAQFVLSILVETPYVQNNDLLDPA